LIRSFAELDERQLDVLRELGNIGAGHAATALSALLDQGVDITVPRVLIEDFADVIRLVGAPEDLAVAALVRFGGDARGMMLFVIEFDDAKEMARLLAGPEEADAAPGLSELKLSTIKEVGNILASSYLGSIGTLAGLRLQVGVPQAAIDMVGALLAAPMAEFASDGTKLLFIEVKFRAAERNLKTHVILFCDIPSLNRIFSALGISGAGAGDGADAMRGASGDGAADGADAHGGGAGA